MELIHKNIGVGTMYTIDRRGIKAAIWDFSIVLIVFIAAFSVRLGNDPLDFPATGRAILLIAFVHVAMLYLFGVYRQIWARTSGHGITVIFQSVVATTVIIGFYAFMTSRQVLPLSVVLIGNTLALGGFITFRYRSRVITGMSWRWRAIWLQEFPKSATRVLIVGAGESGQNLAVRLSHRFPKHDYSVVGFVDDDLEKQGMFVEGSPVLGGRADIIDLAEKHHIDLIVVAIHNISGPDFRQMLEQCEKTNARIKIVPDIFALMNAKHHDALLRDIQSEDLIGRSVVSRHEEVDLTPVRGKSVLVTGAAGSIGSELSRQLCTYAPTQLILLDVNESGLHDLYVELEARYPYLELIPVLTDITNRCEIEAVYNAYRPQVVFHSAAYKHVPLLEAFPQKAVNNNVLGTLNVARFARAFNVERFVLISTDKAVNPSNVMGASKRICEMIVATLSRQAQSSTLFTTVRFGNVLGSRGSVVPTFTKQINNGGPITVTHPEMTRYFMSISEAANLVIHAACLTKGGEVFLLKMGEAVRVLDLAERMIRVRGMRPYQDIDIVFTGVRPGEKLHEQLYDGSAESVSETVHPGIVCLSAQSDHYDGNELLAWVEHLERENISQENALELLLWGMSPNEQFAFEVQTEMIQTGAGD